LLVTPGDARGLAAKLEQVLASAELRQRLATNARRVIEARFDRRTNFAQLKTWLENAAGPGTMTSGESEPGLHPVYDANCVR